jgi:hypothetical protein
LPPHIDIAPIRRRGKEGAMSTMTLRYARYIVSTLASIGFVFEIGNQ